MIISKKSRAALGAVKATAADGQAARVLLANQVTRACFQLQRLHAQADVARRTLGQREETLQLMRDRVQAGLDTRLELRRSEGGLPEARLQLETLLEQSPLTCHALAALVGQPNAAVAPVPRALSAINNVVVADFIPADLLGHRALAVILLLLISVFFLPGQLHLDRAVLTRCLVRTERSA